MPRLLQPGPSVRTRGGDSGCRMEWEDHGQGRSAVGSRCPLAAGAPLFSSQPGRVTSAHHQINPGDPPPPYPAQPGIFQGIPDSPGEGGAGDAGC